MADVPSERALERRQLEARRLGQHGLLLLLALGVTAVGVWLRSSSRALGTMALLLAAACWIASGLCAIAAGRHAFGRVSGASAWGGGRMSSSKHDPKGAALVGGLLIVVGAAVAVWAAIAPASS